MTKIQDASLYEILPFNVKSENIEVQAFSYAIQQAISMLCRFSDRVRVMAVIDDMPESVIDNLAVELNLPCFHVESSLDVKRALVKDAFIWHSAAGTVSAIRRYFTTISQNTEIQEWFEYGGEPYHFRIVATVPEGQEISESSLIDIERQISKLKNVRSILDEALIVKEHLQSAEQAVVIGTANIIESSVGEYDSSSCWLENETFLTDDNDDVIYCDDNENVYTI